MKYLKLKSVTWWTGAIQIALAAVLVTEPLHGVSEAVQIVDNLTGGLQPHILISTGTALIGLRGAMPDG